MAVVSRGYPPSMKRAFVAVTVLGTAAVAAVGAASADRASVATPTTVEATTPAAASITNGPLTVTLVERALLGRRITARGRARDHGHHDARTASGWRGVRRTGRPAGRGDRLHRARAGVRRCDSAVGDGVPSGVAGRDRDVLRLGRHHQARRQHPRHDRRARRTDRHGDRPGGSAACVAGTNHRADCGPAGVAAHRRSAGHRDERRPGRRCRRRRAVRPGRGVLLRCEQPRLRW